MNIEITGYRPELGTHFGSLNKAWLRTYFSLEPMDEYVLGNPEEAIIGRGGHILFALADDRVVGTVALIPVDNERVELAKLAVDEQHRQLGIGDRLVKAVIDTARADGYKEIILYSHTRLESARALYKRNRFAEIPLEKGVFKRPDLMMSLRLDT